MHRVLKPDGKAIIIVGRESNVRGISFKNWLIVALLAIGGAGFQLEKRQERKFRNKFGEIIYEDILHFLPSYYSHQTSDVFAREVALWCLRNALVYAKESVKKEILDAIENTATISKSPIFDGETNRYKEAAWPEKMRHLEIREKRISMVEFPIPHVEKLKAIRKSTKLPQNDVAQVEKTIEYYEQWIASMNAIIISNASYNEKLRNMVISLNEYRLHIDIDLVFDSREDWLYREKGQIKLDNSVIEEFLPRLVYACLKDQVIRSNALIGPTKAFSAVWFDSNLVRPEKGGGMRIRTKDQDFAISKPLYLRASDAPDFRNAVTEATNLAYTFSQ